MNKIIKFSDFKILESSGYPDFMGIQLGKKIGEGVKCFVFELANDINKVIKIEHCLYDLKIAKTKTAEEIEDELEDMIDEGASMKNYPDIFVTVFQHGLGYCVLEKVNTEKAENELNMLQDFYENEYGEYFELDDDCQYNDYIALKKMMDVNINEISETARKWYNFINHVYKVLGGFFPDINHTNFGYDSNGNIKLFDYN